MAFVVLVVFVVFATFVTFVVFAVVCVCGCNSCTLVVAILYSSISKTQTLVDPHSPLAQRLFVHDMAKGASLGIEGSLLAGLGLHFALGACSWGWGWGWGWVLRVGC